MKKILLGICALGLFASCDPSKDSVGVPAPISESELASGFTYTQTDEAGSPSATGNFFQYTAPRVVTIYRLNSSGGQVILAKGSSAGSFILKPTRGSDPTQTFYVQSREFDGSIVTASYNVTVDVPGDLTPEMKIACSDSGTKIWKWDGSVIATGAVWGNLGYTPGEDWTTGVWWGCPPEDLTGQLQHSNTGVATGEEDNRAYMVFSEEGTITTYDAGGNQIRKGAFEIQDYNNGEKIVVNDVPWKVGNLHTDAGTILFPFKKDGLLTDYNVKNGDELMSEMVRVKFRYLIVDEHGKVTTEQPMELYAGFIGIEPDRKDMAVVPKIGWIVRKAENTDAAQEKLKNMATGDKEIDIRVREVPEALKGAEHLQSLTIRFADKVVVPLWMDHIKIDRFTIYGEMTDDEKATLKQRFPKMEIKREKHYRDSVVKFIK